MMEANAPEERHEEPERLVQKIAAMNVSEKVKLALKGSSEARGILVKDSNKQVVMSVLENSRITDGEIVAIARNRSALDEALRTIADNKEWMKNYQVVMALVTNPKTPPGIAMKLVGSVGKKDLKLLEKSRGVSEAVRSTAKRTLQMREKK